MNQPRIIGSRYEILHLIGQGGIATVYKGRDTRTGEIVAVKILKGDVTISSPELIQRFVNEGEALRRLNHPNIVKVLDSLEEDGKHYIIMEYVSSGDLKDLMDASGGKLPVERVMNIALDLSDALIRAHRLKIVHRDIKPLNVLIAEDGTPRLSDFGVAHFGDNVRVTQTGDMIGTLAYLSPEGCMGEDLDTRTDIWSFGIMLYEMLTGRRPFNENGGSVALLMSILQDKIKPVDELAPDTPPALATLIMRMLDRDRDTRIGSFRLVGAQLEAIITGTEIPLALDDEAPTARKIEAVPVPSPEPAPVQKTPTTSTRPRPPARPPTTSKRRIERPVKVYLSYVRSDTPTGAESIYRRLVSEFGEKSVVKDLENTEVKGYFGDAVEDAVAGSDVLLVVIGRDWQNIIERNPVGGYDDYVRLEAETGLSRDNVLVIPVLVDGAEIPEILPDRMHDLVYRYAVTIRDEGDISTLVSMIKNSFEVTPPPPEQSPHKHNRRRMFVLAAVLLAILLIAALILLARMSGAETGALSQNRQSIEVIYV